MTTRTAAGKNDPASGMNEDDVVLPAFSFISHEAKQFEKLREAFGLSEEEYLKSFKGVGDEEDAKTSLRVIERSERWREIRRVVFLYGRYEISLENNQNEREEGFVKTFEEIHGTRGEVRETDVFAAQIYGCYRLKSAKEGFV